MYHKITNAIIGVGMILCSSILFGAKCIAAALNAIDNSWSKEIFTESLKFTPTILNISIYCTLVVGIVFILLSVNNRFSDEEKKENL